MALQPATQAAVNPWTWNPHPEVWLALVLLAGGYAWAVNVLGPRKVGEGERAGRASGDLPGEKPASAKQVFAFYSGIILLWFASDWPLHDIAERYLFSFHMIQHLAFMLVVPPLLLLGTPRWLLRSLIGTGARFRVMRVLTKPVVALLIFNGTVAFIHWPVIVGLQTSSNAGHGVVHALILGASIIGWWPVVSPLPELGRMTDIAKMFYLFLTSVIPTVPASFLTFAEGVLYQHYETVPRLWGLTATTDQMIAGLIMKIGGGLLLWSVIAVLFFRWNAREERAEAESVSWDDFERELEAWDMRK
ncbi:MAG: cytochrome c oxidase assembly protein [Actinomycetota bacterium]